MSSTFDTLKESRLAKMREGQAAGEIVVLPGRPDVRFVLVPLTDGEYLKSLQIADKLETTGSEAGLLAQSHVQRQAIIAFAAREMNDWTQLVFDGSPEKVGEALEQNETNFVYDLYLEMIAVNSPSLYMMSEEEFEELKKVWQRIEWSELSGTQQYAAMRFLRSILDDSLLGSYFGSPSTLKSTTMSESETPASPVDESRKEETRVS